MTETLPVKIDEALAELRNNPAYKGVVPMLESKFIEHYALVQKNNSNVARIQESKNTDPNSTEYQDATWHRVVAEKTDPALVKLEAQFQKLEAAREKALAELRELAKAHMQPALSEEGVAALRKEVNDGKAVIQTSVTAAASIAEMADQMLALTGKPVENGIWSLMPQPDSLMNARGRKAGSGAKGGVGAYSTRITDAFIDGKSTNREVKVKGESVSKAHFNFIAEELSKDFNDKQFPGNQVTAEEVEHAYYDSKSVAFRESDSMPVEHEFTFTKNIEVQNPNDDSTKEIPMTRNIKVIKWTKPVEEGVEESKPESDSE